jgi:molybdopterin synthase catalytic subunit
MDIIKVETNELLPWKLLEAFQATNLAENTDYGATSSFIGTMRDFNEGDDVTSMFLEHYPQMTERQLQDLVKQAKDKWTLLHTLIVHRVGLIKPGEPIVLVAVWTAHRAAAFDACRFLMESLKSTAPFWKKEALTDGSERWVSKNTDGH